jgi:hypothetical protein
MGAPGVPINPFDPAATAAAIFKTVGEAQAAIPDGHTHAILINGTYAEQGGASAMVEFIQKAPNGWNIVADGFYDQPHGAGAGVQLAKSW